MKIGINSMSNISTIGSILYLPIRELIITRELASAPEYMTWFRYHDKPYLLLNEARGRQHHTRRPRRLHRNPRSGVGAETSSSSAPTPQEAPVAAPPLSQDDSTYSSTFTNPVFFTQAPHCALSFLILIPFVGMFFAPSLSPAYYTPIPMTTPTYLPPSIVPPYYLQPAYATPYTYTLIVSTTPHSTTEEGDEDKHDTRGDDEDEEEEELEPQLV
ncbi:hypothetical protein Gotur_029246 [Gossypium turneri]